MTIPAPWIAQLTRTFVRKNNLQPNELDVVYIRDPKYVNMSDSQTGEKNMKATFIFKSGDGNYQGSELFTYKTVVLEKLFANNSIPVVWGYNPRTTKVVAKLLIDRYGLPMHEDWFVDEPIDGSALPTHFTIKTKDTDWCAASQLTVRVEQSDMDITELFKVDAIDAPSYYITDPLNVRAHPAHLLSTYGKDFTPLYSEEIETVSELKQGMTFVSTTNPVYVEWIRRIVGDDIELRLVSGGQTDVGVLGQLNIYISNIEYHGTTKGYVYKNEFGVNVSADSSYDKVIVVWGRSSTDNDKAYIHCPLFLHYNEV